MFFRQKRAQTEMLRKQYIRLVDLIFDQKMRAELWTEALERRTKKMSQKDLIKMIEGLLDRLDSIQKKMNEGELETKL